MHLVQLRKRHGKLSRGKVTMHFVEAFVGIPLLQVGNRLSFTTKPVGAGKVSPTGRRIAMSESLAGSLQNSLRHIPREFFGRQKVAECLGSKQGTGFVVSSAPQRYAGFSKSQSPGGEHGRVQGSGFRLASPLQRAGSYPKKGRESLPFVQNAKVWLGHRRLRRTSLR